MSLGNFQACVCMPHFCCNTVWCCISGAIGGCPDSFTRPIADSVRVAVSGSGCGWFWCGCADAMLGRWLAIRYHHLYRLYRQSPSASAVGPLSAQAASKPPPPKSRPPHLHWWRLLSVLVLVVFCVLATTWLLRPQEPLSCSAGALGESGFSPEQLTHLAGLVDERVQQALEARSSS